MRRDSHRDTTPRYQGRPLARPDDDVVDQGLGFDLGTLLGRRQVLRALGLGAATVGLAACSANTAATGGTSAAATVAATGEIPDETAGAADPGVDRHRPGQRWSTVRRHHRRVFGDDGGASQLATVTGDVPAGFAATLAVPVDTTTEPTGGGSGGFAGG